MPNLPVDMDSWGRSACYPRSTFYLLSDAPSTRKRRIIRPCFHICSTHRSRSQAPFYPYALHAIANRIEGAFGLLRYSLGGDRPSQTTHLPLSLARIHGTRLEFKYSKGGISLMAPPDLATRLQSLPPMLHILYLNPIIGCSKGSRGLSV